MPTLAHFLPWIFGMVGMVHRSSCTVLALLLAPVGGKIVDGVVKLSSQDTEMYVTKFSFSPSVYSTINGTFHTDEREYFDNHPHSLMLCLYDDVAWPKFQTACAPAACGTCAYVHAPEPLCRCAQDDEGLAVRRPAALGVLVDQDRPQVLE